jgi:DNA-directed RNA polymerase specialized sigma24 family protein
MRHAGPRDRARRGDPSGPGVFPVSGVTLGGADPRSGMNDRTLDRLFDRFRRQGDVAALGEVFDGTASELLRVGMFLSRSAAEAEDLLQATFVTAIERAGQYDGSRALLPWLLGILAHHARDARRRGQRAIDPGRLERAAPEDPHVAVEAAELERELLAGTRQPSRRATARCSRPC